MKNLKKFLTTLVLTIILSIGACSILSAMNLSTNTDSGQIRGNIELSIPSGNTNEYNPFRYLDNMPVYWGSGGWDLLYNYNANPNRLAWIYNGITVGSSKWVFDTGPEIEELILDFNFSERIQVTNLNKLVITLDSRSVSNRSVESFYIRYTTDWSTMLATNYEINIDGYNLNIIFNNQFTFSGIRIQGIKYSNTNTYNYDFFRSATYGPIGGQDVYKTGYDAGYDVGYDAGYDSGYDTGFDDSTALGISNPEHIFYSVFSIFTLFGDLFLQLFTTSIWGDLTIGFVFIILPFSFKLIDIVIHIVIKLFKLGG